MTRDALVSAERGVNRLTNAYEPALRLIEVLLDSSAIALDDETSLTVPGFLFDMHRLFQALLARLLVDGLPGWQVRGESTLNDMMRYAPALNPRRRRGPKPRPDFLLTSPWRQTALLDAKYRDFWARELPREMLYQLAVYSLSQPRPSRAAIVYPTTEASAGIQAIEIREPAQPAVRAHVLLRPLHLGRFVEVLRGPSEEGLRELAASLVYGSL